MLGYRDSCMKDSEHNARADAFANADQDEAVGRLVAIIRRVRPQVVVTYPDARGEYDHPDHVQVPDISVPAFHAAGDPGRYPGSYPGTRVPGYPVATQGTGSGATGTVT